jgi:hypothetical protein
MQSAATSVIAQPYQIITICCVAMQKAGYAGILFGLTRSAPAIGGHQISKDRPLF